MQIFRVLWACALLCYGNVVFADEVYQKVTSLSEMNETDTYIICDENSGYAIRKTSGNFLGAMIIRQQDLQGDDIVIDPDRVGAYGTVPDEFHMVYVKENTYYIQYVGSGECLYYDSSNSYLRKKKLVANDAKSQWTFKVTSKGVSVDCANRNNYFISIYGSKFGVYTQTNGHTKTCLYKKVATKAKRVVVGEAGYVSFVASAMNDVSIPVGLRAYVVKQASTEEVTLSMISVIPKNTAVVLHGTPGTYYLHYSEQETSAVERNLLKVSDGTVAGDGQTIYSLACIGGVVAFYLVGQDVLVPAGKVYLQMEQASHAHCLMINMNEQKGITTGIKKRLERRDKRRELQWERLLFRNGRKYLNKRK